MGKRKEIVFFLKSSLFTKLALLLMFIDTNTHSFTVGDTLTHADGAQRVSTRASTRRKYTSVITL